MQAIKNWITIIIGGAAFIGVILILRMASVFSKVDKIETCTKSISTLKNDTNRKLDELGRLVAAVLAKQETEMTSADKKAVADSDMALADRKSVAVANLDFQLCAVSNSLEKVNALMEEEDKEECLPAISLLLQTARRELSRTFALDKKLLPSDSIDRLKSAANEIAVKENEFNRMKGELVITKLDQEFNAIDTAAKIDIDGVLRPDQKYSKAIAEIEKHLFAIQSGIPRIYDHAMRSDVEQRLKSASAKYADLIRKRNRRYQEYAIWWCEKSFEEYKSYKVVSDNNAIDIINKYLADIDQALLVPAVSSLYMDVLAKLLNELPWNKRAELEIKLATDIKKRLEDF